MYECNFITGDQQHVSATHVAIFRTVRERTHIYIYV